MWVVMNDSFVSVVQDRTDKDRVVVRARVEQDLVELFPDHTADMIETTDSDYRFRLFLNKRYVAKKIEQRVMDIDYPNFKDSVTQSWRKLAYTQIWQIMYNVQEKMYGTNAWWVNYR